MPTVPNTPATAWRTLLTALALWEELFVVLILLKLPVAYVGYVLWWAIKAEPELGTEGGTEGMNWAPWRRPSPSGSCVPFPSWNA